MIFFLLRLFFLNSNPFFGYILCRANINQDLKVFLYIAHDVLVLTENGRYFASFSGSKPQFLPETAKV
ncbi:MAG: hypothetical protein CVV50_02100 [Spirochaetae bacterium HGW-Spirochaetae-6]|nr:MAG: hypothetical protein CVV50_02100 [Spirochaetae bacterium HGW-Spirochaetae-6]